MSNSDLSAPSSSKRRRVARRVDNVFASNIDSVHKFFVEEKEKGSRISPLNVVERTALALNIGRTTVKKVLREGVESFPEPRAKEARARERIVQKEHVMNIREAYVKYVLERKRKPTYRELFACLTAEDKWPFCMTTLFNCMRDAGFKYTPAKSYLQYTHEKRSIILQRQAYLARLDQARAQGRWIYYQDESWINAHMRVEKEMANAEWDADIDMMNELPPVKSGKGARSILCGIGSADDPNGFLKGTLLLFRGSQSNKSDDYHTEMNSDVFLDWMAKKVMPAMPKLPQKAAIVIDRATYHLVCTEGTATPSCKATKAGLVDYCEKNGILIPEPNWQGEGRAPSVPYRIARKTLLSESCGVSKLYLKEVIKRQNIQRRFKIQDIVDKHPRTDVILIILPVHHPELNPIELIWSQIKHYVRAENVNQNQGDAERLVKEIVEQIDQAQWKRYADHVRKFEQKYNDLQQMEEEDEIEVDTSDSEEE